MSVLSTCTDNQKARLEIFAQQTRDKLSSFPYAELPKLQSDGTFCGNFLAGARKIRAAWDHGSHAVVSKLATPSLILGVIFTLIATAGCISVISGWKVPGISIFLDNMPMSVILFLTIMRTGLHSIAQGVKLSLRCSRQYHNVTREDRMFNITRHVYNLEDPQPPLSPAEKHRLDEVRRLNAVALPEHDLKCHHRIPNVPYGNNVGDLFPAGEKTTAFRKELLGIEDPQQPQPEASKVSPFWDQWYDWWEKRLPALGALDIALGQIMLITGISVVVLASLPSGKIPAVLSIISKDPYLSVAFAATLIGNWINCTKSGIDMMNFKKRRMKRELMDRELQLIAFGLERARVRKAMENMLADQCFSDAQKGQIRATFENHFGDGVVKEALDAMEKLKVALEKTEDKTCGCFKKLSSYFSNPSIVVGIFLILLGVACFTIGMLGSPPPYLQILFKNTPLTIFFSGTLIVSGLHAWHRGASMGRKEVKKDWKKREATYRDLFLVNLFPQLATTAYFKTKTGNIERPQLPQKPLKTVNRWNAFWIHSLKVTCIPDALLGLFFLFGGCAGLAMCFGAPVPASLSWILREPSFSALFCFGLLGVAADCANSAWRQLSDKARENADRKMPDELGVAYHSFYPEENRPAWLPKPWASTVEMDAVA